MYNFKIKQKGMFIASFALLASLNAVPSHAIDPSDPIVLTFSTVGDSRQDPVNIDPTVKQTLQVGVGNCPSPSGTGTVANPGLSGQDCKWLQNTQAWSRIMRSIQAQKPKLLFFNGDMIMGYGKAGVPVTRNKTGVGEVATTSPSVSDIVTSDLMQFYQQYGFWRGMVANMMETGTYIVPVPGNHETQCKRCGKAAQVENENAWRDNMGDLILDQSRFTSIVGSAPKNWSVSNAPAINGADGLTTNQQQLSYSFDVGPAHFAVINTDAVGKDGHAPTEWLKADFLAAEANGAKTFFVFGHKAAFFYGYLNSSPSDTSSLNNKEPAAAEAFWDVIAKYKATYFCGHEHIYNVEKYTSLADPKNSAYQVMVGAGGSPFETSVATATPTDRMYSWATVNVHQSGKAVLSTWGFDDTMQNPIQSLKWLQLPVYKK
jgi:hypothetical protein